MDLDLVLAKRQLRREMRERRAAVPLDRRTAWSAAATARLLTVLDAAGPGPVAAFRALPEEIATDGLIEALVARHGHVLLPRQEGKGRPLVFRRWAPGEPLVPGPFGVSEPAPDAPVAEPRIVVVPLLAFDDRGYRLGYGGGFYDRTLARLQAASPPPLAIGFAFELQHLDAVPVGPYDRPLDGVVTEAATRTFAAGPCSERSPHGREPPS